MSGKQPDHSSAWSDWIWSEEHQCQYATRYGPTGEIEYEYKYIDPEEGQETPRYIDWDSGDAIGHDTNAPSEAHTQYTTSNPPSDSRSRKVTTSKWNVPVDYGEQTPPGPSRSKGQELPQSFQRMSLGEQGIYPS